MIEEGCTTKRRLFSCVDHDQVLRCVEELVDGRTLVDAVSSADQRREWLGW